MRHATEDPHVTQLLAEGSSVYVFGERRIFCPRYVAVLVRMTDESLELRLDPDDLSKARIKPGQQVLLGFAVPRRQMRFGATVMALSADHRGRLVVSAPLEVEKWPQRGYVRAPFAVPCELALSPAGSSREFECAGTTLDVSASGARVHVTPTLPDGDLLSAEGTIRLHFSDREPLVATCRVVRMSPTPDAPGEGSSFAVQYRDLPEQDEMEIQLLVLRATARRFLRVEASVPCRAELRRPDGQVSRFSGVSENVSGGGLLIRFSGRVPVEAGSRIALEVSLPSRFLAVADAEVVRAAHGDDHTDVAVDFGELDELDYQSLIRFVIAQLRGVADAAPDSGPIAGHSPAKEQ